MSLAIVMAVASGVSALAGAVGAVKQGEQQQQALDYNASVERANAQNQINASQATAQQQEQVGRRQMGDIAASFGAAGVDASGSPLAVLADQAANSELTRQITLYRGKIGAASSTNQAAIDTLEGQNAAQAGYLRAGGTLLSAGTNFANTKAGQDLIGKAF